MVMIEELSKTLPPWGDGYSIQTIAYIYILAVCELLPSNNMGNSLLIMNYQNFL